MTGILSVRGALPEHRYDQREITEAFAEVITDDESLRNVVRRLHGNAGVDTRHLTQPLADYATMSGFTEANATFCAHATELGARALVDALKAAGLTPSDVDLIACATVTGIAIPTLDARIAALVGLRPDVKRLPLVGLGCVAGAAGVARVHDYLEGHPGEVGVMLSVELCSLTVQRDDTSVANMVASGLFGDGAAAVVLVGDDHGDHGDTEPEAEVVAVRSRLYPDSERIMGFDIGPGGLKIVLDARVPAIVAQYVRDDVDLFLADHGLTRADVGWWVCHPGGPKVIDALQEALGVTAYDVGLTRDSLARIGNLSSASVLHVLGDTFDQRPPAPGSWGMLLAMGPGFCAELVLLRAPGGDR